MRDPAEPSPWGGAGDGPPPGSGPPGPGSGPPPGGQGQPGAAGPQGPTVPGHAAGGARGGPPPGAPLPPAWARREGPGRGRSFAGVRGDPGAWAAAGILTAVVLTVVADLLLLPDEVSIGGFRAYANGTLRAHFLVATGFASVETALALLVAVALPAAIRPAAPASFRRTAVAAAGGLAAVIAVLAVLRALIVITYGHAFGVSGFVGYLATVPVAVAALAIAMAVTGRPQG